MRQIRLLLVDDSARFLASAVDLLGRDPRVDIVGQAADGATGLWLARDLAPDLVLVDLVMPGVTGIETTVELKAMSPAPVVHIVSMHDDAEVRARAASAGADGFISKADFSDRAFAAIDAWFAMKAPANGSGVASGDSS